MLFNHTTTTTERTAAFQPKFTTTPNNVRAHRNIDIEYIFTIQVHVHIHNIPMLIWRIEPTKRQHVDTDAYIYIYIRHQRLELPHCRHRVNGYGEYYMYGYVYINTYISTPCHTIYIYGDDTYA